MHFCFFVSLQVPFLVRFSFGSFGFVFLLVGIGRIGLHDFIVISVVSLCGGEGNLNYTIYISNQSDSSEIPRDT